MSGTITDFSPSFADAVAAAGVDALIVHARAAILGGLNRPGLTPKENREIPPLKYAFVHRLKRERPDLPLVINGGFLDSAQVAGRVARGPRRGHAGPRGLPAAGSARGTRAGAAQSRVADSRARGRSSSHGALHAKTGFPGHAPALRSRDTCTA